MAKEIKIKCTAADTKALDELIEFQGGIKKLNKKKHDKLRNSILNRGFIAPVFIWDDKGIYKILDGHQRLKVLIGLRENGYDIPLIPVVYVQAKSEEEAKSMLLSIASQYGEFVIDELEDFTEGLDIEDFNFADVDFKNNIIQDCHMVTDLEIEKKASELAKKMIKEKKGINIMCPECGNEFTIN